MDVNWSSFRCGAWERKRVDIRYYFILETGEEENWEFGYRRDEGVGWPDLVAEDG